MPAKLTRSRTTTTRPTTVRMRKRNQALYPRFSYRTLLGAGASWTLYVYCPRNFLSFDRSSSPRKELGLSYRHITLLSSELKVT